MDEPTGKTAAELFEEALKNVEDNERRVTYDDLLKMQAADQAAAAERLANTKFLAYEVLSDAVFVPTHVGVLEMELSGEVEGGSQRKPTDTVLKFVSSFVRDIIPEKGRMDVIELLAAETHLTSLQARALGTGMTVDEIKCLDAAARSADGDRPPQDGSVDEVASRAMLDRQHRRERHALQLLMPRLLDPAGARLRLKELAARAKTAVVSGAAVLRVCEVWMSLWVRVDVWVCGCGSMCKSVTLQ